MVALGFSFSFLFIARKRRGCLLRFFIPFFSSSFFFRIPWCPVWSDPFARVGCRPGRAEWQAFGVSVELVKAMEQKVEPSQMPQAD